MEDKCNVNQTMVDIDYIRNIYILGHKDREKTFRRELITENEVSILNNEIHENEHEEYAQKLIDNYSGITLI